jgi:hypothetical protein
MSDTARPETLRELDDAGRRLGDVLAHRRKRLDERLGDWSDAELTGFVDALGRYNKALDDRLSD